MLFSSPAFFIFFCLYLCAHILLPIRYRIPLIIVGSTFFYGFWKPIYVIGPPFLILTAYGFGLAISRAPDPRTRKRRMTLAVLILLAPLLFFKYTNFFYNTILGNLWGKGDKVIDLALPLGISFITFTLISYVVDIYKRVFVAETDLASFWACILYFPHLIAGPIVRPSLLIDQFRKHRAFARGPFVLGLSIFTLGLLKKLVFADQIAVPVNQVYALSAGVGIWDSLLAIYGFSVQIYCDFSGYTDMALGLSTILGVRLPQNFAQPYTSRSLIEFWRRWHITLSNWLRDYVYIPIGGNRVSAAVKPRNIIITFAIGGLWHGANWTFVIWGLMHGIGLAVVHQVRRLFPVPRWLGTIITFHFVTLAWIFFRASNLANAKVVLSGLCHGVHQDLGIFLDKNSFVLILIALFLATHWYDRHSVVRLFLRRGPRGLVWALLLLVWTLALALSAGHSAEFIYFDF